MNLSEVQARWSRLRRSGLVEPFPTPEAAARTLAGVQAQILPAAGLALWNRTSGLTYNELEYLLYEKRSLVKLWGQRGTLHIYASEDWPLIHGALSDQPTWRERRIEKRGGDLAAYRATVARVAEMLRQRGTVGREDLRATDLDLSEGALSSWGGIFVELVHGGHACHARPAGSKGRFAHRTHWLPDLDWDPPPAEEANVELARRFLHAYGPVTAVDLGYWRCVSVGKARRWIAALGAEVAEVSVEGQAMWLLRADLEAPGQGPPPQEDWPVRLLGRFEPLLLGIKDKAWVAGPPHYKRVWRPAGDIEGTLLEHGRIAGTWRYGRKGSGLSICLSPFAPLSRHLRAAVEQAASGVARFFGLELVELAVTVA